MKGLFFLFFLFFRIPLRRSTTRSRSGSLEFNSDSDRDASPQPWPQPRSHLSKPPQPSSSDEESDDLETVEMDMPISPIPPPSPEYGWARGESPVCLPIEQLPLIDDDFNYVTPAFFVGGDTKLLIQREENDGRPLPYSVKYERLFSRLMVAFRDEELHPRAQWCKDVINGLVNQMRELKAESDFHYALWRCEVRQPHFTVLETDSEDDMN